MSYIKKENAIVTKQIRCLQELIFFLYMWLIQSMNIFLKIENDSEDFKEIITVLTGSFSSYVSSLFSS